jgi:hypothetical protein
MRDEYRREGVEVRRPVYDIQMYVIIGFGDPRCGRMINGVLTA